MNNVYTSLDWLKRRHALYDERRGNVVAHFATYERVNVASDVETKVGLPSRSTRCEHRVKARGIRSFTYVICPDRQARDEEDERGKYLLLAQRVRPEPRKYCCL